MDEEDEINVALTTNKEVRGGQCPAKRGGSATSCSAKERARTMIQKLRLEQAKDRRRNRVIS